MTTPTIQDAAAAQMVIGMINQQIAQQQAQLETAQQQVTAVENYDKTNDLARARATAEAIANSISLLQGAVASQQAIVDQFQATQPAV